MNDRIGNAPRRVYEALEHTFEWIVEKECERLGQYCESPIEVMLGATFATLLNLRMPGFCTIVPPGSPLPTSFDLALRPQYRWKSYRIDFSIVLKDLTLFVECDGHEFHERTKEQAERDRQKDREIQGAGLHILRFTGSEIYRDPGKAAVEIMEFIQARKG